MRISSKFLTVSGIRFFLALLAFCLFPPFAAEAQTRTAPGWSILWGTDLGLYSRNNAGPVEILWTGGKVFKIIPWNREPQAGAPSAGVSAWVLLADNGIWVSENLKDWEQRCRGLPERVIKIYENGKTSFVSSVQEIKDLEIASQNPEIMVCAVKDAVYFSQNGGRDWQNTGMPNYRSNGIKAVAAAFLPGQGGAELTIFCSHSIYGVYYINPLKAGAKWTEMNTGFEQLETTDNPDEISDFAVSGGNVYASQSFRRRIYKLDAARKTWTQIWSDASEIGMADSLSPGRNTLKYAADGKIMELAPASSANNTANLFSSVERQDLARTIKTIPQNYTPNCVVIKENPGRANSALASFSELWLLNEGQPGKGAAAEAENKEGLYLPVNHAMDPGSLKPYLDIIEERNLNMVVIDMKDDYGRLRFTPENPSLVSLGRVFRPVDIDTFLKTMKERGIYTVARIVVFKDPEAARKEGGKYAVWDEKNNKPWEGYYDTRRKKSPPGEEPETNPALVTALLPAEEPEYEILRTWYDEKWVDPYSEVIWDYNASVSEELHRRGFDEIQFDYIRFPTDGENLADARFRWKENGMDMDSAILSFLRHIRSRVKAPISVDIYGANGWYRTGARTGQEVELLAPWVDIICPMYYPSHFEQHFLAQNPPERRPYRIYYQGTYRTRFIARGQVIVRPWAQAFYLNVSYDRKYYNTDYVRLQAEGVRAAGTGGLTYWNNSGRYDDIPYPAGAEQ